MKLTKLPDDHCGACNKILVEGELLVGFIDPNTNTCGHICLSCQIKDKLCHCCNKPLADLSEIDRDTQRYFMCFGYLCEKCMLRYGEELVSFKENWFIKNKYES